MKDYDLYFHGYSWEEYFHVISNKSGILVVYKGYLDKEGFVNMKDIIYIDEADKIGDLYCSEKFDLIRKKLAPIDRLFFSYAEMPKNGRKDIAAFLNMFFKLGNIHKDRLQTRLLCKGACALFPQELLSD